MKKNLSFWPSFWRIARLAWSVKPALSLVLCLVNVIQGVLPICSLWIGKVVIDNIVRGIKEGQGSFVSSAYLLAALFALGILSSACSSLANSIQTLIGDLISNKINVLVMEKTVSLDLLHYEDPAFHDMLTRAQREASHKPIILINQGLDLLRNMVTLSSMLFTLFRLHWLVVVILMTVCIPQSLIQRRYARKGYSLLFAQTQETRKMSYFNSVLISPAFFKEIKLLDLGSYLIEKYKRLFYKVYKENRELVLKRNFSTFGLSVLTVGNYIGVYAYLVYQAFRKAISLGDVTLYLGAFSQCQARFDAIISGLVSLYENNLFISNLFYFLAIKPSLAAGCRSAKADSVLQHGISFKGVSFQYPGTAKYVLKELTFDIYPEESIAIVGDNGAGKTTIVKLLSRLYDPDSGEILLDGINIKSFDLKEYRALIGIIFQDFSQFYLTAKENIGFGWVDEINNKGRIKIAAALSGADKVIERLPEGYESILGRYFDNGVQLSVGEWQKIAIARAFMRNSRILILDEPTASLDAGTEHNIIKAFKDLTSKKTSILISHRLSIVRMADRILVLDDGKIIEQGIHEDLLKLEGKYAQMFRMQAEKYVS